MHYVGNRVPFGMYPMCVLALSAVPHNDGFVRCPPVSHGRMSGSLGEYKQRQCGKHRQYR